MTEMCRYISEAVQVRWAARQCSIPDSSATPFGCVPRSVLGTGIACRRSGHRFRCVRSGLFMRHSDGSDDDGTSRRQLDPTLLDGGRLCDSLIPRLRQLIRSTAVHNYERRSGTEQG
jgi:hypothetical protein